MKLDFTRTFKTRSGKEFMFETFEGARIAMTAFDMLWLALDNIQPSTTGDERYRRYQLQKKMEKPGTDFSTEDVAFLKKVSGEHMLPPHIVGQLWDFLEQKDTPALSAVK